MKINTNLGTEICGVEYGVLKTTKEYYSVLAEAIDRSSNYTVVIGWDFDFDTEYSEGKTFRDLFEKKFQENENYKLYLLIWSGVRLGLSFKKFNAVRKLKNRSNIVYRLATDFPFGGSHHAKVVCVDGELLFTGGMDIVEGREDDRKHLDNKFQDTHWILRGKEIVDFFKNYILKRWGKYLDINEKLKFDKSDRLEVDYGFRVGDFLVSENMFEAYDYSSKDHVKNITLELIEQAKDLIYIQNQYFASEEVRRELKEWKQENPEGDLKIMLPVRSRHWLAKATIDKITYKNMKLLGGDYFYNLFNSKKEPVYIHGKVMIVDDKYLKIGSSNLADRSFGVDSEIDLTLIAKNKEDVEFIRSFREDEWFERDGGCEVVKADVVRKWYYFLPFWLCELFDGRLKSYKI